MIPQTRWTVVWALLAGTTWLLPVTGAHAQPAKKPSEAPAAKAGAADADKGKKAPEGESAAKADKAGEGKDAAAAKDAAPAGEAPAGPAGKPADGPAKAAQPLMGPPSEAPAGKTAAAGQAKPAAGAQAKAAVGAPPAPGKQPSLRPTGPELAQPTSEVYAEDWWKLSRPSLELHGYFRVRAELFHDFALGRRDASKPLWPQPPDHDYTDNQGQRHKVELCGSADAPEPCDNGTQAGANMRFRFNPELHISDNVRVRAQIDLLDNVVLGSTPEGYANQPGADGGYQVVARGGYAPLGAFSSTQWAPSAGVNSTRDSIVVKRVWGEYSSPIGQLRFGRMPSHWGLGMFVNSGDGHDDDWQSTADRVMFITGVRSWDLYFAAAWDFANEGPTSALLNEQQGQAYDLAQQDDVDQWVFVVVRRLEAQRAHNALKQGDAVIEGGTYVVYRRQTIANDTTDPASGASLGQESSQIANGYSRRGAEAVIPDLWFRFRYEKFRLELESAMVLGGIDNTLPGGNQTNYGGEGWELRQFGIASETSYRALDDKLKIGFKFGYASGDDDVASLAPIGNELQPQLTLDRTYSTFRFHPEYDVDLILFRNVLSRVQGAYYFRPEIGYEILREPDGQKLGADAALIWSRATEFVQTPGHGRDLGIELNFKLYYQAKDGPLNDNLDKMGGFFTSLEYGVLFPLDGLGYQAREADDFAKRFPNLEPLDTETAQTIRWYLGILY